MIKKLILAFAAAWVLAVAVGDVLLGLRVVPQWRSAGWPNTVGTIVEARLVEVTAGRSSRTDAVREHVELTYRYTVAGREHIGRRWRFGAVLPGPPAAPRWEVGEPVRVWYEPGNAARSVLVSGLTNDDRAILLAAVPFNVGLCLIVAATIHVGVSRRRPARLAVRTTLDGAIVRLTGFGPAAGLALGLFLGGLGTLFVALFFIRPTAGRMPGLLAITPACGLAAMLLAWLALRRGAGCVRVDDRHGQVRLPSRAGMEAGFVTLSPDALRAVAWEPVDRPLARTWRLVVRAAEPDGDGERQIVLGECNNEGRARAAADWLAERFRLARDDPA